MLSEWIFEGVLGPESPTSGLLPPDLGIEEAEAEAETEV